jgi:hypothetical protein
MTERMTNWPTNWPREIAELKAERDVLRAQVQAVRNEVFAPMMPGYTDTGKAWVDGYNSALRAVHAALDGDA